MSTETSGAPIAGAPHATKVARFVDASIPVRGVVIVQLGDGTSLRMTTQALADIMARPFNDRTVAYDVDAAGNRYNARVVGDPDAWRCLYCGDRVSVGVDCQSVVCAEKRNAARRRMGI